jgi:hypothetical protein
MAALSSSPTGGNITLSSTGATSKTVSVSGTVNANPTITGATSVYKNATISLTGSGTKATTNPWISSNTTVATVNTSGLVTGNAAGTTTITYTNNLGCQATSSVTVFDPVITVSASFLAEVGICKSGTTTYGNQSFTVSGTNLGADIVLTAPTNFEISTASSSGFSGTLTLPRVSNAVASTTIFVRVTAAATAGRKTGTLTATSTNATTRSISLKGGSYTAAPTISASNNIRCGTGTLVLTATTSNLGYVKWYASVSDPSVLDTGLVYNTGSITATALGGSATYYAAATNTCGTTSTRAAATGTAYDKPSAPVATTTQHFCSGAQVSSISATGSNIRWYASSTGGTALSSTATLTNTTYHAASFYSTSFCESATRTPVVVNVNASTPVVSTTNVKQCGTGNATLTATATHMTTGDMRWYDASTGGNLITGVTQPANGSSNYVTSFTSGEVGTTKTYYVEAQNACGTSSRTSIAASSYEVPAEPAVTAASRCTPGTLVLSASTAPGMSVEWFPLSSLASLGTGLTYTTPSLSTTTSYRAQAYNTASSSVGLSCTSGLVPVTATVATTASWNGDGNWNDATKWSCGSGTTPSGTESITVVSGILNLNSDIEMLSGSMLSVANNATLKIAPTYALTIASGATLSNAGTVLVDADANDYGQLLLKGIYTPTGSGTVTVKRAYNVTSAPSAAKWIQISSPVSGNLAQLGNNIQANNLFYWDAQNNNWEPTTGASTFDAGKGYTAFYGPNGVSTTQSGTITLSGTPFNNVAIPTVKWSNGVSNNALFYTSQKAGWNLIGNPFTCNLDYSTFSRSNVDNAFYRWDPNKGGAGQAGYHAHAPASADFNDATIPPLTAVWIRASNNTSPGLGSGNITHANNGRRNKNKPFKNTPDKFLLTVSDLSAPSLADNLSLAMVPGTSDEFDGEWDAWELINSNQLPNVYANFNYEWTTAKAVDFNDQASVVKVVPVGVKSPIEMRPYRMHLDANLAQPGYTVYLRDLYLNQVHNLSTSDYVFAYASAMEDRFELILTNAKTGALGLEEESRGALTAWVSGSELWITGLESGAQEIDVVGMDGRVVLSTQFRAEEGQPATTFLPELPAGLYTVRVRSNGLERGVRFAVQR